MSTHNICFCGEIRKILCGYPLLSVAMILEEMLRYFCIVPCGRLSLEQPCRGRANNYT